MSERDLVVAFKGGDAHAYAVIYRQFRPVAESICLRILGNHDDAQEAAQETMLRVFQGLPRFNGRYLIRAWVARIATNVCLDMIRKRSRRVGEVETPAVEELEAHDHLLARQIADDPGEVVERRDEARRLRRTLGDLPEHHRDALLMREFDGLSHEEMALKLGMTAPQVKALLHRAKKGLRRAWEIETGRASSFMFPALIAAPLRWIRRVLSPAKDAVADAAAPVIHLSSHPAVAQASTAIGERAAAAAGAILVAGTIGIGASVLPNRAAPAPAPPRPSVIVAEPDSSASQSPIELESVVPADMLTPTPSASGSIDTLSPRPRPKPDASPSPDASQSPFPSQEPSPTPTAQPPATSGPAPAWGMRFDANVSSFDHCGCILRPSRTGESSVEGKPGGSIRFKQAAHGPAYDAEGDPAWGLTVNYTGTADRSSGSLSLNFSLSVAGDVYTYTANIPLSKLIETADGWTYRFQGDYAFSGGPSGSDPIPRGGPIAADIKFWSDGTLYRAEFSL
ncbi:MAG TPA: sigma-70 family RNA polymerase sigma factor [Actinomycetota bacterium]